jgi:hypothetical protein
MHLDEPNRGGVGVATGKRRRRHCHLRCRTLARKKGTARISWGRTWRKGRRRARRRHTCPLSSTHRQRRKGAQGSSGGGVAYSPWSPREKRQRRKRERTRVSVPASGGVAGDTRGSAGFGPDYI